MILLHDRAGRISRLTATAFPARDGLSYTLRFRVVGLRLLAKVWPVGQAEPWNWMVTATERSVAVGYAGLRLLLPRDAVARVTSFRVVRLSCA